MTDRQRYRNIAFVASDTEEAVDAKAELENIYGAIALDDADVIVALGGDGLMLQTLHDFLDSSIPIYGMNCGSVGFMMNEYRTDNLPDRLAKATETEIHPLAMTVELSNGKIVTAKAINEVSMLRQTAQAAKLEVSIDGKVRLAELICDGILVATPAGSTAYNLSAHGPILPIYAPLLALTPISPFRPRHWRGALLPNRTTVQIRVLEATKRPVSAVADHTEFREVEMVTVSENQNSQSLILSDADHSWDERILTEQFNF